MRFWIYIREIFKKFPALLITNVMLLIAVNLFSAGSLFTVSPIIDYILHPGLKEASPLTKKVVGVLSSFGIDTTLSTWLIIFIALVLLSCAFLVLARYIILVTKYAVLRDIMLGTFNDFFDAQWQFFSSGRQGILLNTFGREITVVGDAFSALALLFASTLQMCFFLVIPLYISWQVTLSSIGISVLFAVPFTLLGRVGYRLGLINTKTSNELTSVIQENISLAKIVLGFGNQNRSADILKKTYDIHRRAAVSSLVLQMGIPIVYRPFGLIMVVISLFISRRFGVSVSETAILLAALLQVAFSIGNLATQKNTLENFFPSYEQVRHLRERAVQLKQRSGMRKFNGFESELRLEKVSFAYPGHKVVLRDITLSIPKGYMIAVAGESGVGKSTLIDIIMGFQQPTEGEISFDKIPLWHFDILSYRRRIGYVPQDSVLFNMTIRDNLLWAYSSATADEIREACRLANADEFIKLLPKGYDTFVGDRGVRLSGGQIQRVALTRAILRKPDLLILDEATSALDTYSERLIQQAIENIAKKTTIVVVAHRLSTIMNADYIYLLGREGHIIEEGTYAELLQKESHFSNMVRLQALQTRE